MILLDRFIPWVRNFPALPPLAKLAIWAGGVAATAAVVQAAAWVVGVDFHILASANGGRAVLLGIALGGLFLMMAADRRPAAAFGLAFGENWAGQMSLGFVLGLATYSAYCVFALLCGGLRVGSCDASLLTWLIVPITSITVFPLAISQQVIFSGYLVSLLNSRYSRAVAVLAAAAMFAAGHHLGDPSAIFSSAHAPLTIGMFFIAALLCTMRLYHGSILEPTGLLAGWLFTRRMLRKTHLLALGDPDLADWFAPHADPRQAPMLWLFVALAIGCYAWRIRRRGEQPEVDHAQLSASFKRVAPFSNVMMLAPLDLWISRLVAARFQVGAKYIPRMVVILVMSAVNTVLALPERILAPLLLRGRRVPDPLFILGVHRSGTTHLHNILSMDPQLVSPRAYQIMNPLGFLTTGWLITPILGAFSPWKRPMDSVRFHIFAPNEEEFALAGMCRMSPYWGYTFPKQITQYDRFIHPETFTPAELSTWKQCYMTFLRKLVLWSGKRPCLKSPHNTARVSALKDMFPRAKFVHIYRHPEEVYRSNMHMAREGNCIYQLQDPDEACSYASVFLDSYRAMEDSYYDEAAKLEKGQASEVSFNEIERDPKGAIRRIYTELGLDFSAEFERRLDDYLATVADYEKNRFKPMAPEIQQMIYRKMAPLYARWGYPPPGASKTEAA